jgi:uncharacterized DUF497 family protein
MEIEFDPIKDAENIRKHDGLSLSLALELDWSKALIEVDERGYDEIRMNAIVPMGNLLYFVSFTERGERMRPISLRRVTNRERNHYVQEFR